MLKMYHFIGIGGIGMSGLAHILLAKKIAVSGSDLCFNYTIEGLINAGAAVHKGHSADLIFPHTHVVYGSDIRPDNPEYIAAIEMQCALIHRSELLAQLSEDSCSIAVTGTHGKTTTSALLSAVFVEAGLDPSFAVGGMLPQFHANSRFGQGQHFIFEADESDGSFLKYSPFGAIVTNIDKDHLNNYNNSEDELIQAFNRFMSRVGSSEHLFWCAEDIHLTKLNHPGKRYGFGKDCDWIASHIRQEGFNLIFDIKGNGVLYKDVEVALIGKHNVLNALAIFGLSRTMGISEDSIRKAFASFRGIMRRCEKKGEINGVLVIDDYAHHPTEIATTLQGIRQSIGERRLVAVFQPHRYTRTRDCLGLYGSIFDCADEVIITDIYGAGELPIGNLSHEAIMEEVQSSSSVPIRYSPRSALNHKLADFVQPHDVVVTLGAGDINKLGSDLIASLEKQPARLLTVGLIFGGSFTEHEISIRSANNIRDFLKKEYYRIEDIGITKQGTWITGSDSKEKHERILKGKGEDPLSGLSSEAMKTISKCDLLIPVLHGPYGEDGTIQGLFEMAGKAYVGCDYRSASICMDKAISKKLVFLEGIKTSPFVAFTLYQWKSDKETLLNRIRNHLIFPLFVKPSHCGSSIGIKKVSQFDELEKAIDFAFCFDTAILVENGIVGRELEFAVLGNDIVTAFPPGEIPTGGAVYDYDAKYGPNGIEAICRAEISDSLIEEGRKIAASVYRIMGCTGLARIDFFLDEDSIFWFNEVNPMPGFTPISLYPQICATNGLSLPDLMDHLVILALERRGNQNRISHGFQSRVNAMAASLECLKNVDSDKEMIQA